MPYETFTAVDFALDERFRRWVRAPSPETDAFWTAFLDQHPNQRATVAEARLLVGRLKVNAETASPERLQQVWDRIQQDTQTNYNDQQAERTRVLSLWRSYTTPLRWAAVWGGLILLAGLAYYQFGRAETLRYETAYGETKTLTLPDGSEVTLNGHSTLTLANNWDSATEREVLLTGEAFFAVTKQKSSNGQPVKFRVQTTGLRIEVLGTRFNVNHRRNKTEVTLQEGRVQVSDDKAASRPTVMKPGEMVTYMEANRSLTKAAVDPQLATSWRHNLLIYRNERIADIAQELSDSYGIQIQLRNREVASRRFSGSIPTDTVPQFFEKLQRLYGVSVRHVGQRYIIE